MKVKSASKKVLLLLAFTASALILFACARGGALVGRNNRAELSSALPTSSVPQRFLALQDAVKVLKSFHALTGVDANVFTQIKDELEKQLSAKGVSKFTSKPPTGEANRVTDLTLINNPDGSYTLTWTYKNVGDYNQDGIVDIADIAPLAENFFEPTSPDNEWIDGNLDLFLDIADIAPLAEHFFTRVAGYIVEVSTDEGTSWEEVVRVPVTLGSRSGGAGRLTFSFPLTAPIEMGLYRVRPYADEDEFGDESKLVRFFTAPLNLRLNRQATPPLGGSGTSADPLIVEVLTPYQLIVEDPQGGDVSADVFFETYPPAFLTIGADIPRTLTVDNALAGDFWIIAKKGAVAPIVSNKLYFRVRQDLPQ